MNFSVVPISQNVQDTSTLFSIESIKKCQQCSLQKDEKSNITRTYVHLLGPMASCLSSILMVTDRPEQSIGHAFLHNLAFRGILQIKKKKTDFILL